MIKIFFICHGNICRSPMAEFLMKDMVAKQGLANQVYIASAATSMEEIGNGVHRGTRRILEDLGISCSGKRAIRMEVSDYKKYDYLIGMDHWNKKNMMHILKSDPNHKVSLLLDYTSQPGDIADPWYTGNFDRTYDDIKRGCQGLLHTILSSDRWNG